MTKKNPQAIIDQLSPQDALSILKILAEGDSRLAERIAQIALDQISEVDPEDVAAVVFDELEALEVEEVWERAGATRDGYVETGEVADEMIQRVLAPYLEELTRDQKLDMPQEAMALCMGMLKGLYQFERTSTNEFKDWATDLPLYYANEILEQWYTKAVTKEAVAEMRSFIDTHLPHWSNHLLKLLPSSSEKGKKR